MAYLLKIWMLHLREMEGSFNPEKVRTDEEGKAESKFTAGCDPGKYKVWMEFCGSLSVFY